MAKVYLDYVICRDEQDPAGGDNNDEIYYLVESGSTQYNVSRSFDLNETVSWPDLYQDGLLENDAATASDPCFFTLWEDDSSGDDKFYSYTQESGGDPGTIKDGGIYFDGTPGSYSFELYGYGGTYEVGFSVF